ncbi:serine/threonine-protein kinase PAK 3-like [Vidua macroura]|uniref:serine/threonine-protein kinase PAK 3-like n=1 Tax=Vidua macroura TaxID=187451 RepID=UPI0023A88BEF|nr:serine/threonine-protein kinase PAK 3-like [Vidua macroura]
MENPVMKYTELEYIGRGTFGDVCRALDNATGGQVAIKKINLQELRKKELKVNELMLMKPNKNPNLVNYLDSYRVDGQRWLVMEYMDGGTLSDVISETHLSEDEMAAISREPQLLIAIRGTPKLRQPNRFSSSLRNFLRHCLRTDAARRWSAKELLQDGAPTSSKDNLCQCGTMLQHPFVTSAKPASTLVPLINSVKKEKKKKTRI